MNAHILDNPADIGRFRLAALARAARLKAEHGISLARNLPTLRAIRAQYGIDARTWKAAAIELAALLGEVEAGDAYYELRGGVCYFSPGRGAR